MYTYPLFAACIQALLDVKLSLINNSKMLKCVSTEVFFFFILQEWFKHL